MKYVLNGSLLNVNSYIMSKYSLIFKVYELTHNIPAVFLRG